MSFASHIPLPINPIFGFNDVQQRVCVAYNQKNPDHYPYSFLVISLLQELWGTEYGFSLLFIETGIIHVHHRRGRNQSRYN